MGLKTALQVVTSRLSSQPARTTTDAPAHSTRRRKTSRSPSADWSGVIAGGRYRLEAPIGTGASGIIYSASQTANQRKVAVKVLRPQYEADAQMTERLLHEANMASAVRNEHVIEILDSGRTDAGKPFVVMEYIQGQRLSDLMDQNGGLDLPLAIDIASQLAEALRGTHKAGIFHGDVKPDNILMCRRQNNDHFVKLIDFGVAGDIEPSRVRQRYSMVCGTPSYMSPEQASGETLDGRTDIYSLGVVMYEMLSGSTPIQGTYPRELLTRQRTVAPRPLRSNPRCSHVPARIEAIVHRCLEKDPARRYQNAADLLRELSFVQSRLQNVLRETPGPQSEVSMVRATFAGLPKLTSFATAMPANDLGRPLTSLPLPASGLTPTPPTLTNELPLAAPVPRPRTKAPVWAGETRESRRPGKKARWKRGVAPLVLLGVALGYVAASLVAQVRQPPLQPGQVEVSGK